MTKTNRGGEGFGGYVDGLNDVDIAPGRPGALGGAVDYVIQKAGLEEVLDGEMLVTPDRHKEAVSYLLDVQRGAGQPAVLHLVAPTGDDQANRRGEQGTASSMALQVIKLARKVKQCGGDWNTERQLVGGSPRLEIEVPFDPKDFNTTLGLELGTIEDVLANGGVEGKDPIKETRDWQRKIMLDGRNYALPPEVPEGGCVVVDRLKGENGGKLVVFGSESFIGVVAIGVVGKPNPEVFLVER
ncbi:MAG: hypothetical protein WCV93_01490 [Candidatus Shapirobacteria bacterium]